MQTDKNVEHLKTARLKAVARINKEMSSSLDSMTVLKEIFKSAQEIMDASIVSFWAYNSVSENLELRAFSDEEIGVSLPLKVKSINEGAAGWVGKNLQPLNVPDIFSDSRFQCHDWWKSVGLKSFYGVPINVNESLIGVLSLFGTETFDFCHDDLELLDIFVGQAAISLQNARLYEELQIEIAERKQYQDELTRHTNDLSRSNGKLANEVLQKMRIESELRKSQQIEFQLAEIGRIIGSSLNIVDAYHRVASHVQILIPFDRMAIALIDAEEGTLTNAYIEGEELPERGIGKAYPLIGMLRQIYQNRKGGIFRSENLEQMPDPFVALELGLQSLVMVPLVSGDEVLGILAIRSKEPNAYKDRDLKLAQRVSGQISGAISNARLYEERVNAENRLKDSLREKEVLLKEIHHRVKNNLQIIHSLLSLQAEQIQDVQALGMFKDSQNRVRSMALIHEKLYQSENLTNIDFTDYVDSLVIELSRSYMNHPEQIEISVDVRDACFGVDTAIPCGLIINELITNSLKYAFPDNRKGQISVSLQPTMKGEYTLIVKDNGIGFPENIDWQNTDSLGMQVVTSLTDQLEGEIELSRTDGTEFKLKFTEST